MDTQPHPPVVGEITGRGTDGQPWDRSSESERWGGRVGRYQQGLASTLWEASEAALVCGRL